jgi:TadE-like protein
MSPAVVQTVRDRETAESQGGRVLTRLSWPHRPPQPLDTGAVAVEFALLLPLLMMFLFGIIQYGYGFYQIQSLTSVVGDATQQAANGIESCDDFSTELTVMLRGSGLDPAGMQQLTVTWLTEDGAQSGFPSRLGKVRVTLTYTPFTIGVPFVPFPSLLTRTQTASVQDIAAAGLSGCALTLGTP